MSAIFAARLVAPVCGHGVSLCPGRTGGATGTTRAGLVISSDMARRPRARLQPRTLLAYGLVTDDRRLR